MQEEWDCLKRWLIKQKEDHEKGQHYNSKSVERYCVAVSIDDILDKMIELEDNVSIL